MSKKILLTGATGYVGGTVLATLLSTEDPVIRESPISVLVRKDGQAHALEKKGVRVFLFQGFDDHETIRQVASEHDVVIHTASGFHTGCARSLLAGLADRRKQLRTDVYYLHTSGTSSLADSPVLNLYGKDRHPQTIFSDNDPSHIFETIRALEAPLSYPQRTTDLTVFLVGASRETKTCIIYLPIIYGIGTGDFNKISGQIPALMKATLRDGYTSVVGDGQGRKSHVHIEDVGTFYELLLGQLLIGKPVPSGPEGFYFVVSGSQSYQDISEGIAKAATELNIIKNADVTSLTIEEAVEKLDWSKSERAVELAFVSSVQATADNGKSLNWKPRYQEDHFKMHYTEVWKAVLEDVKTKQG